MLLEVKDLSKHFQVRARQIDVLKTINFSANEGDLLAIVGSSGSGKSTLLGICAGLDNPSEGTVKVCGHNLSELDEDQRAALRNTNIGFVFQSFQLLPTLTAYENVLLPLELTGLKNGDKERAISLLTDVGLGDRLDHYPVQLSGGEQQRVALARAFINSPDILFADEPTGNLDAELCNNHLYRDRYLHNKIC